jgi:ketosteroid isomerase-like protein
MDRQSAIGLLDRLHAAQARFYAGGALEPLADLLTEDVVWSVPGSSPIAGVHSGIGSVMAYFARRRDIAAKSFTMRRTDVLTGEGDRVAALTDGAAVLGGETRTWSTLGLYRFRDDRVAACWLLPLDPRSFDEIWSQPSGSDRG